VSSSGPPAGATAEAGRDLAERGDRTERVRLSAQARKSEVPHVRLAQGEEHGQHLRVRVQV